MSVASSFIGGARPRDPAVGSSFMGFWPPGDQGRAGDGLDAHDVHMGMGTGALNGIYVGEGWQPVPGKLAEKIWQWEFVEMAELLPEQWNVRKDDAGALGRRRKQVTNIDTWLQCFTSYTSVMSRRFPEDVVELLGYMRGVLKACHDFSGLAWVHYDATFRKQAAASGNRRWSGVNASLYSLCFTGKTAVAHVASDCPLTQDDQDVSCSVKVVRSVVAAMSSAGSSGRMAGRGDAICRSFNAGLCTYPHCRFRHECSSCGGSHPEVSCGRPRPYAGSNKGNDLPRGKP